MAIAKKCDRCGKFYETYGDDFKANAVILTYLSKNEHFRHDINTLDLCPECLDGINKYLFGEESDI